MLAYGYSPDDLSPFELSYGLKKLRTCTGSFFSDNMFQTNIKEIVSVLIPD